MKKTVNVELTPKFLLYIFIALGTMLVAWEFRSVMIAILLMLFAAFILNAGLRPIVNHMQDWRLIAPVYWVINLFEFVTKRLTGVQGVSSYTRFKSILSRTENLKLGRGPAILLLYVFILLFFSGMILILTTEFLGQVTSLVNALPGIFNRLIEFAGDTFPILLDILPLTQLQQELGQFVTELTASPEFRNLLSGENVIRIFSETLGVFSTAAEFLVTLVTIIIISVYMLQRREPVYEGFLGMFTTHTASALRNALREIESSLGSWMVGQLSLMILIGVITYALITIPGFFDPNYTLDDFAFPIALAAGLLEAIPTIGPAITLVLASLLAVGTSSGLVVVIYIVVAFLILQNMENVFIVPMVMKRAVGIDPIVSVLGIIAGLQIGGIIGSILAIPTIGIAQIILTELAQEYKKARERQPKTLI
jgi:predicted PurR-regulated permease PerM